MKKEAERIKTLLWTIILLTVFIFTLKSILAIETLVSINNTPPYQTNTVPNQTIPMNENYTNVFDLDNYFSDNEDLIDFNVTQPENITITINRTTNIVSFYPDINFTGVRNATFTASDGIFNITSNLFYIIVTSDNESPMWSSPSTNLVNIFQNDFVDFSTIWTDNIQLRYYVFSINQNNGWTVYPSIDLTGTINLSTQRIQISAPAGTNVTWKFLASDWSGNINETLLQSFIVSGTLPPATPSSRGSLTGSGGSQTVTEKPNRPTVPKGFSVTPDTLVVKLKQGESSNKLLKIDNLGGKASSFTYELIGLEEFTYMDHSNATISAGKSDILSLEFFANRRARPDVYYGTVIVKSGADKKEIPIILTINAFEVDITVNLEVLKEYKKITPGNIVRANITLENLKDIEETPVTLYLSINDFSGNVYDSKQENFNISERQLFIEREFFIPKDTLPGDYVFFARLIKDKSTSIDLDTFQVGESFNFFAFIKANYLILLIILVSIITIYLAMYYHRIKEKERLLNLYIMINELRSLLEQNRFNEAVEQYVRIRLNYGEKVNYSTLQNKDEMKSEMESLINNFNKNLPKEIAEKVENAADIKTTSSTEKTDNAKNQEESKLKEENKIVTKKKKSITKKKKNVKKK